MDDDGDPCEIVPSPLLPLPIFYLHFTLNTKMARSTRCKNSVDFSVKINGSQRRIGIGPTAQRRKTHQVRNRASLEKFYKSCRIGRAISRYSRYGAARAGNGRQHFGTDSKLLGIIAFEIEGRRAHVTRDDKEIDRACGERPTHLHLLRGAR